MEGQTLGGQLIDRRRLCEGLPDAKGGEVFDGEGVSEDDQGRRRGLGWLTAAGVAGDDDRQTGSAG